MQSIKSTHRDWHPQDRHFQILSIVYTAFIATW